MGNQGGDAINESYEKSASYHTQCSFLTDKRGDKNRIEILTESLFEKIACRSAFNFLNQRWIYNLKYRLIFLFR